MTDIEILMTWLNWPYKENAERKTIDIHKGGPVLLSESYEVSSSSGNVYVHSNVYEYHSLKDAAGHFKKFMDEYVNR